ncbi:MAG: methionyl-tRNA formyltransferase [Candidatus Omnitrophica bacterium]|nr:methionyl-tRNA formyltransferase [Candidatus Omnitrophota bacterium]
MRIVFFGSDIFALPSLKALLTTKHEICCVVTQPDRESGRGLHLSFTVIKSHAQASGLKIYQPQNVNTAEAIKLLKDLSPDLFIVIAYGQILSEELLGVPKIFSINVHASLLPLYRGAAPINWAIINGDKITGVSVMKMAKQMDAGPVILQKSVDIACEDTAIDLEEKLSDIGAQLLSDALKSIQNGDYKLIPQDEKKVSFAPKLKKKNGLIDWGRQAQNIYDLIRGSLSWPEAFTYHKGKLIKIYKARIGPEDILCPGCRRGEIINVSPEGLTVVTGNHNLTIEELQIEGKRIMKVKEFIIGHKFCVGEILGER